MNASSGPRPRVFRAMKPDPETGAPTIESSARGLGVRPCDLKPCTAGLAHPSRGGMSVAPSLETLPPYRVPARLGDRVVGATGPNGDKVWMLGDAGFATALLAPALTLRVDKATHGLVEPTEPCPFDDYTHALADTAASWSVGE